MLRDSYLLCFVAVMETFLCHGEENVGMWSRGCSHTRASTARLGPRTLKSNDSEKISTAPAKDDSQIHEAFRMGFTLYS